MMLNERKISLIEGHQALVKEGYPKKLTRPSIVISFSTLVLGFLTFKTCLSEGIVLKNSCIKSNFAAVNFSIHALASLNVNVPESSSPTYTLFTH